MASWVEKAVRVSSRPVRDSAEFQRIKALPRRVCTEQLLDLTPYRLAGCGVPCPYDGPLRPAQLQALTEAARFGGLLAPMGVGHGKTLTSLLLPTVMGAQRPVLLVPPALRAQTVAAYDHLKTHWTLVPPKIVAYSDLSSPKKHNILEEAAGDLLVCDEAHCLKSRSAARTKRFLRYAKAHPGTRYAFLSGTMCSKSIRDWAHLSSLALATGSPAPRDWNALESFSFALDDLGVFDNGPPGVLAEFCAPGEDVRTGYKRRVVETPGVVATTSQECDASLVISPRALKVPPEVQKALKELRATWSRPDGEMFQEALEYSRYSRQLACGLYLRWTEKAPEQWLEARRAWAQEVRRRLERATPGLDSPGLIEAAMREGRLASPHWAQWQAVEAQFRPVTEPVWLSEFMAQDAARWAQENIGVVWTRTPELGRRIAEIAGVKYYGDGPKAAKAILPKHEGGEIDGSVSIVCSMDAHYQGRNLQMYDRALVTSPSSNGVIWEQLLGRLHRQGQRSDEVVTELYLHTPEVKDAFLAAQTNAQYISSVFGQQQRLCSATLLSS